MKKTSKAEFNRFKKEFLRWTGILGLQGYKIYFYHEPLNESYAEISINEPGRVADVYFASELSNNGRKMSPGPESHGKHEAIHLFLHRLGYLGEQRFTASDEIHHEAEKLVTVLEKVLT